MVIVITPVKVKVDKISPEISPAETPKPRTIKENSDICPKVVPTRKFVLFVYPSIAVKLIKIIGLKIKAIPENISALTIIELILRTGILNPKIMKKIIKKKSLKGLIFELISIV